MVVLFVVLTILVFLTIDFFVQKVRQLLVKSESTIINESNAVPVRNKKSKTAESYWMKTSAQDKEIAPTEH